MFTDEHGRRWRYRTIRRDGTVHYSDSGILGDGEHMTASMLMADSVMQTGGVMMTDTMLNDAQRRFEDTYGAGAECLTGFSERAKALYALGDAKSNEVFRVQEAASKLRTLAIRASMVASGQARAIFGDSADNSLAVAAFLTRQADMAQGRADALLARGQAGDPMRFDHTQNRRIGDAQASGNPGRVAYEIANAERSNAWMRNR